MVLAEGFCVCSACVNIQHDEQHLLGNRLTLIEGMQSRSGEDAHHQ